jgi:hypothetical protein
MATVSFLNTIRKNLPPNGQRVVDHISVESATDQPDLAEEIAPLGEDKPISNSTNMAQLATDRIMSGLPFRAPKDAIYEDYVMVWLQDMAMTIQKIMQRGAMATPDELTGLMNLGKHIGEFLAIMATNEDDKQKVKQYEDAFGQLMNHVKALAQRLQESMQQDGQNGQAQVDPKAQAQAQATMLMGETKAKILASTAAMKQQQKEEQFQADQRRKDAQTAAEIARTGARTRHELMANRMKTLAETAEEPTTEAE